MRIWLHTLAATLVFAWPIALAGSAKAADYIVDNNTPQTQADLPVSPNTGYIMVGDANPGQSLTFDQSYQNALMIIGHQAGSTKNIVTITDLGTKYSNIAGSPTAVTGPAILVG